MKSILYLLAYILAAILMCSCGSRKRAVKVDVSSSDIIRSENKNITTNVRVEKYADRVVYTPVDVDKEMILPDGRRGKNVVIVEEVVGEAEDKSTVDVGIVKEEIKDKSRNKYLNVETKKPNPWLWIGLVVATLGGAWVYFNRLPRI